MQRHHTGKKQQESDAKKTPLPAAQEPDEAGKPDEDGGWVEIEDLSEQKGKRVELLVLVLDATVLQKLPGGPMVVRLPEEVGGDDDEQQGDPGGGPGGQQEAGRCGVIKSATSRARRKNVIEGLFSRPSPAEAPKSSHSLGE